MSSNSPAVVHNNTVAVRQETRWDAIEETARKLYAPNTNDAEWGLFLTEARELDLSPAKHEFMALAIGNEKVGNDGWRKKYSGYITIHGVRALAARTGMIDGTDGPYWCGPDGLMKDVWLDLNTPPVAARFTVFLKGMSRGFSGTCTMKRARTHVDRKTNKKELNDIWVELPEVMLATRAEVDAYRRAGLLQDPRHFERAIIAESANGSLALVDQDANRLRSGRMIHAVGAGRGVDHDGIRKAVQSIDPAVLSLADADTILLDGAADEIAVMDAEGVERLTGVPASRVKGSPATAVPEPVNRPEDGRAVASQIRWLSDNFDPSMPVGTFSHLEQAWIVGEAAPTYDQADELIQKMARILTTKDYDGSSPSDSGSQEVIEGEYSTSDSAPAQQDQPSDDFTAFWKEAKAAGFPTASALLKASGLPKLPDDMVGLRLALKTAMASQ